MATKITKQQLADKLREAETVLVTTDASPSISQLSAGLGLVGILEDMDKSALFVYDGEVSPALDFLKPSEAISADAESLRDFIISFDTSKVDKFRYTQEDNQYNILLTPGRKQVINEEDIRYHKGDFNIDLVLSLGVSSRSSICQAVGQHAQLMDSIPMVNILTDSQRSSLETEFWQADTVCSLGEMIYDLSQAMEDNYRLDRQVANATLLTSIVEYTERFKNKHTQADTMHISGELIRYGADPSLVAESLAGHTFQEEEQEIMELEEIVQSADAESAEKVQAETAEKETARKKKRKRMYMREGDVDANFSIGKRAEVKKQKQEKEHKISQVKVDAHGNIQISSSEADAKTSPAADAEATEAAPAVAEAVATAPAASAEDSMPSAASSDAAQAEEARRRAGDSSDSGSAANSLIRQRGSSTRGQRGPSDSAAVSSRRTSFRNGCSASSGTSARSRR